VCSSGLETEALTDLLRGARGADCGTVGKDARSEPIADVDDRERGMMGRGMEPRAVALE
jgi:hypothetical protein